MKYRTTGRFATILFLLLAASRLGLAQNPFVADLKSEWDATRKQIVQIAEAMPEDKFQFRATPEVRSYGEILAHFAGENVTWLEYLEGKGKPGPNDRYGQLKSRQEILKALNDSFDYGDKIIAGLTDQKAMESVPFTRGQSRRWLIIMHAIEHCKEHYGNLVTYLRLNNIVPPSTAAHQRAGAAAR